MIRIRRSDERGHADHGWLDTYHSFSFDTYYDPAHMGFRSLRVINEDRVAGGAGFPTHAHRDMEIVTYVLEGALQHHDSIGNQGVIRPGELQRMSAGTGVRHSEFNASSAEPVHFLQIWILPAQQGISPSYEQKTVGFKPGTLQEIAGPQNGKAPGSRPGVLIHQDAKILAARLSEGESVAHTIAAGRHAWLQVARGSVQLGEQTLAAGDGAAISDQDGLTINGAADGSEILLFDLA